MESTGVYWIPIYEILEERGFEVYLVNARHLKNVPTKKTDVLDSQWIQQLHTYGLLNASFRPEDEMVALRAYIRHRDNLIRYRAGHVQHMQKALHLMNIQLTNVISDLTGQTGMEIMRAIVAGEHNPVKLAQYRDPRCRSSEAEIAKALSGHYREEHLFALKQALELYDFYHQQIQACDTEIEQKYAAIKSVFDDQPPSSPPTKKRGRSKNEPAFDLHRCLLRITLAPHNAITGGKLLHSRTQKSTNRAAQAFRMAAQSAGHSHSALGAFYRRIRAKHGGPKAITATAHKIARIYYHMLKHKQEYNDPGQDYYEQKYRERVIKNLERRAKDLGLQLVPIQPGVS